MPESLIEAVRYFSDLDVCHKYMVSIKWPDGKIVCPKCGGDKIGNIASRRMFQCKAKGCRKQFSAKVGTIFEDSPLPLSSWFVAVWCITNAKNGISSCELARALDIQQRSAWHMLHRVRLAMRAKSFRQISGTVESDESFFGGTAKFMHAKRKEKLIEGRGPVGKTIAHGLLERGGEVVVDVVPDQTKPTLHERVRKHVKPGSFLFTDQLRSYEGLDGEYVHRVVNHAKRYVDGLVHTNGLENFWSLVKRCVKGTYIRPSPWHLLRYLDEEAWRFNKRKANDGERFQIAMQCVVGKQLTYAELTGKMDGEEGK